MPTRTMTLVLDEADFDAVQREIARRQARDRAVGAEGTLLPPGDSNLAGAILAECCRDLEEYRELFARERGPG